MLILKRLKKWWKENQEKSSDRYIEREELKESLEEDKRDISIIMNARFHEQFSGDRAFQMASVIQNLHMQRKLTQATKSLRVATWMLALATGLFTWVAIMDSKNSNYFLTTLQGIMIIIVFGIIILIVLALIWEFIKFIYKRFRIN